MIVKTYRGERVVLADEPLASGGEGEVRAVITVPSRFVNVCAKLYFKPKQTKEHESRIRYMVENPPTSIVGNSIMLAWPLETIYLPDNTFVGFIMPIAFAKSKKLTILTLPKLKKSYKEEWYKFDKEGDIKTALISRLKLINNISIPIHFLHETNKYVLKDFKPDNVLVSPTGEVTIVDMDSIQICNNEKLIFSGTAATENYVPPEFYNQGVGKDPKTPLDKSWDNFAIAVVFYQLLFGLNPYVVTPKIETEDSCTIPYCIAKNLFPFGKNASDIAKYPPPHNNFNIVPSQIKDLFIRAFGDNPKDRPSVTEWGKTIHTVVVSAITIDKSIEEKSPINKNIKSSRRCPRCRASVLISNRFCKSCGYDFSNSSSNTNSTSKQTTTSNKIYTNNSSPINNELRESISIMQILNKIKDIIKRIINLLFIPKP